MGVGIQLLLARMIAPEYFGVVATALIVLNIMKVMIDGGFGAALVQRKNITRTDVSTVFYLNVVISVLCFAGLALLSQPLALYFEQPDLRWIIPSLSLTLLFASLGQAQAQMLIKQLKFKLMAKITFPAVVFGGLTGILLAICGANIWALIGQQLAQSGLRSALLWWFTPRELQPNFKISFESFRRLSGFSFGVLGNELLRCVTQNLVGLIIAKSFGAEDLAFYNRARFFQRSPTQPLVGLLNRVLFPVFSEIQDDKKKICSALRTGIPLAIGCVAPLMFWLMASAEPLIIVTLTEVWSESIQYLRVVPLMGITLVLSGIKSNVIRSQGDGQLIFLLSLFRNTVIIGGLLITWRFGIMAMIVGQVICFLLNMLVNDFFTQRYTGYSMREQWADWAPYVGLSAIVGLASMSIYWANLKSDLLTLIVQTVAFVLLYLLGCRLANLIVYQKLSHIIKQFKPLGRLAGTL